MISLFHIHLTQHLPRRLHRGPCVVLLGCLDVGLRWFGQRHQPGCFVRRAKPGVGQKNMDEATEGLGNVKHHWLRSPRPILGNTPNFVCVFRWGQICVYQGCSNLLQVHHCHMQGWHIQEITKFYLQISTLFPPQTYVGWPGSNPL